MPENIPNFHDGHFDGILLAPNKVVHLFLRTVDQQSFALALEGVSKLNLSGFKEGNIIFDLVFRGPDEITRSDVEALNELDVDSPIGIKLLQAAREARLQILEINPSYGAQGPALFLRWSIKKTPQV
jgi:hypothetical protein